jgi:uncharacterized Zn-finger protein
MLESQPNYVSPIDIMSYSRETMSPVSISPKSDNGLVHELSHWNIDGFNSFIDYKTDEKTLFNYQYPSPAEFSIFHGHPSPAYFSYEPTLLDPTEYLFEAPPNEIQVPIQLRIPAIEVTINPVILDQEKSLPSPKTSPKTLSSVPKTPTSKKTVKVAKSSKIKVRSEKTYPKTSAATIPSGRFWVIIKEDGKTRYKCPNSECDKSNSLLTKGYTRPHNLKSHYLSHTGELPFACTTCKRKFARRSDMIRHEANMHKAEEETEE